MAYEVTAIKRRPKNFDELVGQEFVVSTLKNSLESRQIAHAYLFSGPRGCGKTSAARILARSLNCENGPTAIPCGVCGNCAAISLGSSLDVIEIDGASNTSVNDVRQIKDEVLFPPQSGAYKVYIIDEVHMLSNSAFNALLKTIEEPPPRVVFIFATTELHKVPATIKSRCQQFAFRLISIETIQGILKNVCVEMNIQAEDEALFWIARESTGSLRDAFTLFDQVVSFSAGHIRTALIREKLGVLGLEKLNALAEACAVNDCAGALSQIDEILNSGVAIEQFIIDLTGYYRSLLLLKNGIVRESLLGFSPQRFSALVLERLDAVRLEQALSLLLGCYRDIRYSVSPRFELEAAVSKLAWLTRWVSPPELSSALDAARNVLRGSPQAGGGLRTKPPEFPPGPPASSGSSGPGGETGAPAGDASHGAACAEGQPEGPEGPRKTPDAGVADSPLQFGGTGSLSEDFNRLLAAKKNRAPAGPAADAACTGGGERTAPYDMDEDAPVWSRFTGTAADLPGPGEPGPAGPDLSPQAQRVLRVFPGTIIKTGGEEP
ncbi:MAG: DNA polymerase III subunit gamma/tau [Treponema sp.]|jgi:DNA polymerase-3 subunit gamma/tau|nr:DNA polymerase III subunit gamma/tau [Treponema sp.]